MIKRLRKKFILISIVTVTSVLLLLFAGVNIVNLVSVRSKLDKTINMITENSGKMPEPAKSADHPGFGQRPFNPVNGERFDKETPFQTRFFVVWFDEDENVTNYNLDKIAAVETDEIDDFAETAAEHGEGSGFDSGYLFRVVKQDDSTYMAVFLDCHKETSSVVTLAAVSAAVTLFCIILICIIIVLLSGRAVRPVIESDTKQKQFITDAGHELKTPITVISTCLSVLEMEVGKQKWIDKAAAQTDKLKNLVNSLVTLSKSDEGSQPAKLSFDISTAVCETAESFSDFAGQKGHPIVSDIEPSVPFCGDEFSVRRLVSILIDNAVKYSSDGSEIALSLKKHKKGVLITVSNRCENINAEELPKLFDRFYRADKSRNSSSGGFGLGLSIARSVCESHKGFIRAETPDGTTIVFTAYLGSF